MNSKVAVCKIHVQKIKMTETKLIEFGFTKPSTMLGNGGACGS